MQPNALDSYLETQVTTATAQKLHLMLIDGAIRFCRSAVLCWQEGNEKEAALALDRAGKVVGELLSAVRVSNEDVARPLVSIYLFLHRTLTEAQMHRDNEQVEQVIAVLEEERETWRQVCEKFGAVRQQTPPAAAPKPHTLPIELPAVEGGFSMEA